ncbi:MAG: double-strand break repair helicase AddA [Pseudorhodoplanes sp.]
MSRRDIPDTVRDRQHQASDPGVSAWVAANAGSGKTHVLAQRVIRLLLAGCDPAKILCITFTKAAAANMAMRVFDTLAGWTRLDEAALDSAIHAAGAKPDAATRARARRLFAIALETPGGLKVQTIHAFCTRLLHQFPFEADVGASFEVLDEIQTAQLLEQIGTAVLLQGATDPDGAVAKALGIAMLNAADQTFRDLIREAIGRRDEIGQWIARTGSVDGAIAQLSAVLGIDPQESIERHQSRLLDEAPIAAAEWPAIAEILAAGSSSDRAQGSRFLAAHAGAGAERLDAYLSIYCTKDMKRRASLVTKAIQTAHPDLHARLIAEQDRLCALLEQRKAVLCRDRTRALLTIVDAVIARYRLAKDRRGVLDYEDLIDRTLTLFHNTSAAWVLHKLDLGIDHVLIDEAQDTSPKQWEIIRMLVSEFTAGEGARAVRRSLFAVGDDKQSIFSFQGAAPQQFAAMGSAFKKAFEDARLVWRPTELKASFRSGETILRAVDTVFERPQAFRGLTASAERTVHEWLPSAPPGHVEIWDIVGPDDKAGPEPWSAPFDAVQETSPQVKLARQIARHVRDTIGRVTIGDPARPARPRDILVLVRQRGPLFNAVIRALKDQRVEVAGADRLVLTDHIAVMDLIALAEALLLPENDLALACALKSPIFGLDEDDLFGIAHDRGSRSLRESLIGRAADNEKLADAALLVERLSDSARRQGPFAFYADLLGPRGARRRFGARLGHEVNDALDEFLNLALSYERGEIPTLQGFVAWLRAAAPEIKRDMEIARDEVRVMTVHGAKGLEAPIVYLADTTTRPEGHHPPRLLSIGDAAQACLVWAGKKENDPEKVALARAAANAAAADEYRRLLYVAMTRAAERLIVCGTSTLRKQDGTWSMSETCWYRLIADALDLPKPVALPSGRSDTETIAGPALPAFLAGAVAPEAPMPLPLRPSDKPQDRDRAPVAGSVSARARGVLAHRLLQSLPELAPERRRAAAERYLARIDDLPADEARALTDSVLRILDDAQFAEIFQAGSRAEIPVVGRIGGRSVAGQIDRLIVTDRAILIADYKTDRAVPTRPEDVPHHVRQMALYRALLQRAFPGRTVRAALIFTEKPSLIAIPPALLDAEIATLTPA